MRKKVCALVLACAVTLPLFVSPVANAAYNVKDVELRKTSEKILTEDKGIHEDTTAILNVLKNVWVQGEKQNYSFDNEANNLNRSLISGILKEGENIKNGLKFNSGDISAMFSKIQQIVSFTKDFKNNMKNLAMGTLRKIKVGKTDISIGDVIDGAGVLFPKGGGKPSLESVLTVLNKTVPPILDSEIKGKNPQDIIVFGTKRNTDILSNMQKVYADNVSVNKTIMSEIEDLTAKNGELLQRISTAKGTMQIEELKAQIEANSMQAKMLEMQLKSRDSMVKSQMDLARMTMDANEKKTATASIRANYDPNYKRTTPRFMSLDKDGHLVITQ